jgi:hypothetical protein
MRVLDFERLIGLYMYLFEILPVLVICPPGLFPKTTLDSDVKLPRRSA